MLLGNEIILYKADGILIFQLYKYLLKINKKKGRSKTELYKVHRHKMNPRLLKKTHKDAIRVSVYMKFDCMKSQQMNTVHSTQKWNRKWCKIKKGINIVSVRKWETWTVPETSWKTLMWTQRLHKGGSISLHSYAGWSKGPDWLFSQFCAQAVLSQSYNLLLLPGRGKLYLVSRKLPLLRTNLYLVGLMFTYKPIKTVTLFHRV